MTTKFVGKITKVSRDGGSAVVTLDSNSGSNDRSFAIISPDTRGRLSLMNGVGHLQPDTRVEGEAVRGVEALRAVSVHAVAVD